MRQPLLRTSGSAAVRGPSLMHDSRVLGVRAVALWVRNPASLMGAIMFPIVFFAMFNLVMRKTMTARGFDYAQLLPSTVVVQAMFFTAMSSAYYVAHDRTTGMMQRLRSMPIHHAAPIVARSVGDVSRAVISVLALTAVGVVAGMRFRAGALGAVGFLAVPLVFAGVFAMGMGLIGYRAATPEAAVSLASIPYLPLLMLSTGFAPTTDFPGWLRPFVRNQPVTRTIDLLRTLSSGGPIGGLAIIWLVWMVTLGVVFCWASARLFRRAA